MLGCESAAMACASRSNRASAAGSSVTAAGTILMATSRCRRLSRARYTSPMPPAPSRPVISVRTKERARSERHLRSRIIGERAAGCGLRAAGCGLRATGCGLRAARATGSGGCGALSRRRGRDLLRSAMPFSPSSRARLTKYDLARFPAETLFDRIGRAVCHAGCLPRKELFESWEVARRVRRLVRGGRIVDLGGGHGLLAQVMLLLDDSSPEALVVDTSLPRSAGARARRPGCRVAAAGRPGRLRVGAARRGRDPVDRRRRLEPRVRRPDRPGHRSCARRAGERRRPALLPRTRDVRRGRIVRLGRPRARDRHPAGPIRLDAHGYRIWTQAIPAAITPKNRLLIASPE